MKPTPQRLREIIDYDPESGTFVWAMSRVACRKGDPCGRINQVTGYHEIGADYGLYHAHMIAWAMMTGAWAETDIDHINRVKADNRWVNLRLATRSQNNGNEGLRACNTSGYKGVVKGTKPGLWRAQICVQGKKKNLGNFPTIEEAAAAYDAAAIAGFGEFAITNAILRA